MDAKRADTGAVVVGVDGSATATNALRWAAREAGRRRVQLRIVSVWSARTVMSAPGWTVPYVCDPALLEKAARSQVDDAAELVRSELVDGTPEIECIVGQGHPAEGLMTAARDASLLVVGRRGLGGLSRLVLGSVSSACLRHSPGPVCVVGDDAWPMGPVVVGVDGSEGSAAALRWAAAEAARWEVDLVVVHGWETPVPVPPGGLAVTEWSDEAFASHAHELMQTMVDEAFATTGAPPQYVLRAVPTTAAQAIIEEGNSRQAGLLVVGSRGRGGFASLVLGSVSRQCVHHAGRPIVVVGNNR